MLYLIETPDKSILDMLMKGGLIVFVTNTENVITLMQNEGWQSCIRTQSTAKILSSLLRDNIEVNTKPIELGEEASFVFLMPEWKMFDPSSPIFYIVPIMEDNTVL